MPVATISDKDLLRLAAEGFKVELVDGEIRMSPAGGRHEEIGARLVFFLMSHVMPLRLGKVYGSSMGYHLSGGQLRSPDVSFVAAGRLPGGQSPKGFGDFAPDLAVEILSPWDEPSKVHQKVDEYLRGGVRLVWVLDPDSRSATVYRSAGTDRRTIGADQRLDGEDVLPGFACTLAEVLD